MLGEVEGDIVEGLIAYWAADALAAEEDDGRADSLGFLDRSSPDRVLVGLVEARGEKADYRRPAVLSGPLDQHPLKIAIGGSSVHAVATC